MKLIKLTAQKTNHAHLKIEAHLNTEKKKSNISILSTNPTEVCLTEAPFFVQYIN